MLLEIFAEHNERVKALKGAEYSPATFTKYNTTLEHTRAFIKLYFGTNDIEVKDLSYDFISSFAFWLQSEKKCVHNTAIKYIAGMRKIVTHCLKSGWITKDPFIGFKMSKKTVVRSFLTDAEIEKIAQKQFCTERLEIVRDIFLFSCYTGLAYIDVAQLTPSNIAVGLDNKNWIFTKRQKTDIPSHIPLLPPAQAIVDKYKQHPKCLNEGRIVPILSNQKMNAYLKEIADVCEINKVLTFHIARHTFATTVTLTNGVPIETV